MFTKNPNVQYLKYVMKHKWYVMSECFKRGLYWQGITHDLSKFSLKEWIPYRKYFYGKDKTDGIKKDFDYAWLSHQHSNPHHWQHYILRQDDGTQQIMEMPDKYVQEMICDWIGAGRAITGKNEVSSWWNKKKSTMLLHKKTRKLIQKYIDEITQHHCMKVKNWNLIQKIHAYIGLAFFMLAGFTLTITAIAILAHNSSLYDLIMSGFISLLITGAILSIYDISTNAIFETSLIDPTMESY